MKIFARTILTAVLALMVYRGAAQPPPPPGSGNAPFGFVELLVAGGALLGGKKLYDRSKNS